ncbi:uncharacterized protein BYT42DRAFT_494116 [Radiomyces spectabilis]|uniref:uncharacterized protein n=1 Tax=Radiomyces spectabilis TaxID=64574 RepID=UPI00222069AD|nr:uncharacterized protein BYT42DRAFT_494116 [Radiomyces spectabilis]KAI8381442.1 hypothetical protein BYT42DRAFT_494116 [Radiomyces spectabilis]
MSFDKSRLNKALKELPPDTLLTEIPEIQNSIAHLRRSNNEMREFDPDRQDPDLTTAIDENEALIERYEVRIDLTLEVIRERLGEAAAREMESNVLAFRKQYQPSDAEEGVFL